MALSRTKIYLWCWMIVGMGLVVGSHGAAESTLGILNVLKAQFECFILDTGLSHGERLVQLATYKNVLLNLFVYSSQERVYLDDASLVQIRNGWTHVQGDIQDSVYYLLSCLLKINPTYRPPTRQLRSYILLIYHYVASELFSTT